MSANASVPVVKLASGYAMPMLGFGTWGGGDSHEDMANAVKIALENNYRHFDCAQLYMNEHHIGVVISDYLKTNTIGVTRKDIFLTSKIANTNHAPENVYASVVKSIVDLQCEYLDLVLIHWPAAYRFTGYNFENGGTVPKDANNNIEWAKVSIAETWKAMEQLVKDGYVRSIGVSNFTTQLLQDMYSYAELPVSVNQVELHPYLTQTNLVGYCVSRNIAVQAYAPLGRPGRTSKESVIFEPTIEELAKKYNTTTASILLAWGMKRGTTVLPKSKTPERIISNLVDSMKIYSKLSEEDFNTITALNNNTRYCNVQLYGPTAGVACRGGVSLNE
jgi:diketogulonate reductase-like aldo/keto reductase